ncbi:MAG: hypothetical protein JRI68_09600 [Deltaproteobacteria bacterium]|nr:hypothetical protein [Deltaproteobacteria bacterium]
MLALAACGGSAQSAQNATSDQPPPPEQSAREALEALATTPDQDDQLLALVGKFAIVLSKSGKARRAFTEALIESIMGGRVDPAVIHPVRADFEQAIRDATPEVLQLFNELHGILTPTQRAKLIDDLAARSDDAQAKRKARNEEMMDRLDIGIIQKVNIGSAMKDQLGPLRPAFAQMKMDGKAAGEAFKRADFDATKLTIAKTDLGKLYLEGVVALVGAMTPELEHEQRVMLAGILKHRLSGGGRHR